MAVVSSASNLLAQLDEEDEALRLSALQSLNNVVHDFWFQIASSIASVEAFYEDESFTHRELAALVASKVKSRSSSKPAFAFRKAYLFQIVLSVDESEITAESLTGRVYVPISCRSTTGCLGIQVFFYLGELDVALTYALGAGHLFDVNDKSDYVQTLLGECLPSHSTCMPSM